MIVVACVTGAICIWGIVVVAIFGNPFKLLSQERFNEQ